MRTWGVPKFNVKILRIARPWEEGFKHEIERLIGFHQN